MVLQLGLQGNDFSLAFGGALLERALLGFGVVQAQAQRVALGVQVPGALHQLPDTGSELVQVLQHGRYRKPSRGDPGHYTQGEKPSNIQ